MRVGVISSLAGMREILLLLILLVLLAIGEEIGTIRDHLGAPNPWAVKK